MTIRQFFLRLAVSTWLTFQGVISYGQESELYNPLKIITPAPTAASLGAYGNVPVGYYTGTPDITIPLYEIKIPGFTWPVSLRYNASGVRPSDEASWVGLGWTLSAGGIITRTVRGLDDLLDGSRKGYYNTEALPDENNATPEQIDSYLDKVMEGETDAEPDIFSYNFGPYSGKFVMGKAADGSPVFFDNRNNLKVEFLSSTPDCGLCSSWIITDAMGYVFYFATREKSRDYSFISDSYDYGLQGGIEGLSENADDLITAWHLDKIVSPNADEILFVFLPGNPSLGPLQKTEHQADLLQTFQEGYCNGTSSNLQNVYKKYTASRTVHYEFHLDKIIFNQGSIQFLTTDRDDAESLNSSYKQPKLSEILIKDITEKRIKKFKFDYSYFTTVNGTDLRLKLDAVSESSGDDDVNVPPYSFNYFEPYNLPQKQTKALDNWGFYNGISNTSLLPQQNFIYYGAQYALSGANRAASTDVNDIQKGTLISITYPTGGRTDFDYAVHEFKNWLPEPGLSPPVLYNASAEASSQNTGADGVVAASFHLNLTTAVNLTCTWYEEVESPPHFPIDYHFAWLEKDGSTIIPFYLVDEPDQDHVIKVTETYPAGDYVLKVRYVPGYITTISAAWQGLSADHNPVGIGGGLRVNRITQHDNNGSAHVRKFVYADPSTNITTGRLFAQPKYSYLIRVSETNGSCVYSGDYVARAATPLVSPGLTSQGVIGYDKVTELIGENGEGGRTEYVFHNRADTQHDFPGMPTTGDAYNGMIDYSLVMDASGNPIERTEYSYVAQEVFYIRGIKLYTPIFPQLQNNDDEFGSSNHQFAYFNNFSTWLVPFSKRKTTYLNGQSLLSYERDFYDNYEHKQITGRTVNASDGNELSTTYSYPHDFADHQPYTEMVNVRHIWSPVIETSTFKNNSFIQSSKTNYGFWNGTEWSELASDLIVPQSVESKVLNNNSDTRLIYHAYDSKGNIASLSKTDDMRYTYLWGYNQTYNTARIINAEVKDVFHTSFEEGDGNSTVGDAKTGNRSKTDGFDKTLLGLTNGNYILSYWTKNGNTWSFQPSAVTVTNGTYRILLSEQIDEVRFYPQHAAMITYSYAPLVGMTSQCDENNRLTWYEYDALNRLTTTRDQDGNIVSKIDYHISVR